MAGLPSALDRLDEIRDDLGEGFAVFLDFDGTLAPIVDDPDRAQMPETTCQVVAELADQVPVAVVSGRGLADVRERVGIDGLVYAGDHGFAIHGLEADLPRPDGLEAELAAARRALEARLADVEGVRVEAKRFSLAVHHRQAGPQASAAAREAVDIALADATTLASREGKQVVEVVPAIDWDKGRAVELLLDELGAGLAPVYIGDDTTDETALRFVADEGVGIHVGERPDTAASYRLDGPDEVRAFLAELIRA